MQAGFNAASDVMQGGDCAGFFMQWGLQKEVLRDIWEVVAGDEGRLSQDHFLGCLYLMDLAKRGAPPPKFLPPGLFPPIAGASAQPNAGSSFSLSGMQQVCLSGRPFSCPKDQTFLCTFKKMRTAAQSDPCMAFDCPVSSHLPCYAPEQMHNSKFALVVT